MRSGSSSPSAREASVGSAIRLAAEVVIRFSSIVATLWLTRSLGVSAFGEFLLCLSLGLMIAEFCDLGLNAIVVPMIVRSRRNLRTLFAMKAAMTGAVVMGCAVLVPLASWGSGLGPGLIALTTVHFLGASWIEFVGTTLRALGRRVEEAAVLMVFRFTLVAMVIGAPFGMSVGGAASAYALSIAPAVLLAGSRLRGGVSPDEIPGADPRTILHKAAPLGVNGYLAILSTKIELLLLQAFAGAHVVGLFGGALRIVESLLTIPSAIAAGALPSVARDVVRGSRGAAQRTFGAVVWIGVPAAIGLAMCAPDVLLVLGPGFVDGVIALRILSLALLLCFANAALFHLLIAAGETGIVPRLTGLRVAAAALLGFVLIPAFGLAGAAVSFTAAELLLFTALVRATRGHTEVQVLRPLACSLLACLPMVVLLSMARPSLPVSILAGSLLFAAAGGAILRRGSEAGGLA